MYNVIKVSNVNDVVILTAAHQLRAVILPFTLPPVSHCGASWPEWPAVIACLSRPMLNAFAYTCNPKAISPNEIDQDFVLAMV